MAGVDDVKDWEECHESMKTIGLSDRDISEMTKIISIVLNLGELSFGAGEGAGDDASPTAGRSRRKSISTAAVSDANEDVLQDCAFLFGVDAAQLKEALTVKFMKITGESELIRKPLSVDEAANSTHALSKTVYKKLFDWLVMKLNDSLQNPDDYVEVGTGAAAAGRGWLAGGAAADVCPQLLFLPLFVYCCS